MAYRRDWKFSEFLEEVYKLNEKGDPECMLKYDETGKLIMRKEFRHQYYK